LAASLRGNLIPTAIGHPQFSDTERNVEARPQKKNRSEQDSETFPTAAGSLRVLPEKNTSTEAGLPFFLDTRRNL